MSRLSTDNGRTTEYEDRARILKQNSQFGIGSVVNMTLHLGSKDSEENLLTMSGHSGGKASRVGVGSGRPKLICFGNWSFFLVFWFFPSTSPHTGCGQSSTCPVRPGWWCLSSPGPENGAATGHQGGSRWDCRQLHSHPWGASGQHLWIKTTTVCYSWTWWVCSLYEDLNLMSMLPIWRFPCGRPRSCNASNAWI